jgi:hypothetical protein
MTSIEQILSRLEHHGARLERKPEGGVRVKAPSPLPDDLLEVIRANKTALIEHVTTTTKPAWNPPESLEPAHELKALIRAARTGVLPFGSFTLETGIVTSLETFVLACCGDFILGARDQAMQDLWTAHKAWRVHLAKVLN